MQEMNFAELDRALADAGAPAGAAEVHGVLAGMLCGAGQVDRSRWMAEILVPEDPESTRSRAYLDAMRAVYGQTLAQFDDEGVTLELMLPTEEGGVGARLRALADWCQGFLYGYGVSGGKDPARLKGEPREVLDDIREFANVETEAEGSEEEKTALAEIEEYLRVGVLVVRDELHPPAPQAPVTLQ